MVNFSAAKSNEVEEADVSLVFTQRMILGIIGKKGLCALLNNPS